MTYKLSAFNCFFFFFLSIHLFFTKTKINLLTTCDSVWLFFLSICTYLINLKAPIQNQKDGQKFSSLLTLCTVQSVFIILFIMQVWNCFHQKRVLDFFLPFSVNLSSESNAHIWKHIVFLWWLIELRIASFHQYRMRYQSFLNFKIWIFPCMYIAYFLYSSINIQVRDFYLWLFCTMLLRTWVYTCLFQTLFSIHITKTRIPWF